MYGAAGPWGSTVSEDNAGAITGWSTTAAANGAWTDGSKTSDDPCPVGFRVPTRTQLTALVDNTLNPRTFVGTWTNSSVYYGSGFRFGQSLFLPTPGARLNSNGTLGSRGGSGNYWSSTEDSSTSAWRVVFNSFAVFVGSSDRIYGYSVRCIAE